MEKPVLTFSSVAPIILHQYERYLPTAFDESMSLVQKVNKVIIHLNQIGELTNAVVEQWNEVMDWILNDGITENVNAKLDAMVTDGTLDTIINQNIFNDLNTTIETNKTDLQGEIDTLETTLTTNINTRATKDELTSNVDTLNASINLKSDKYYVDVNLSQIQGLANFARDQLTNISWYNRQYWLDETTNDIMTNPMTDVFNSWYVLENNRKLVFTVAPETKWVVVGMGQDFSTRAFAVNIMGLTNRSLREIPQTGSAIIVDDTIVGAQASVGDKINIKINAETIMFYKNGVSWFSVITSNYPAIEHVRLGIAHTHVSNAYTSLSNFMDLDDYATASLITPPNTSVGVSKWRDTDWLLLGDSITANDGKTFTAWAGHENELTVGYQSIVNEKVNSFNQIVAKAYGGTTMTDNGSSNAGVKVAKATDFTGYELVSIFHGTNDFKLNQPIGSIGSLGTSTFNEATFYGAYRSAVESVLKSNPTTQLILITPLQRDNDGYTSESTNTAGHKLIDYVNAIKAIGNMYGLPVLDLYNNSGFNKLTLATYTYDGLHPNNTGYEVIGEKVFTFIEKNV